jgi:carbon-monoxide dehydrogenase large subunit
VDGGPGGAAVRRREDRRLLTGRACYLDDLRPAGTLAAAFVRSLHAHARIAAIDGAGQAGVFAAADFPGVRAIVPRMHDDGFRDTAQWPLARDTVRYVGEPVAVVLRADRYAAEDAADRIAVRYEPLPVVAGLEAALDPGAPRLHPLPDNVLYRRTHVAGDPDAAFRQAELRVETEFAIARVTALPLEGRGIVAYPDGDVLVVWTGTQVPSLLRTRLAVCLGLPEHRVRVVVPDTGGGFGQKMHLCPEDVAVAALALRTGRPVKWIEDRRENLTAATQAREARIRAELAARRDGTVLGLRAAIDGDVGAYHVFPTTAALEPLGTAQILPGPYAIRDYAYETRAVCTNKPPTGAYRGVGMTAGVLVMERLMDKLALAAELDPADVRRRNLIPAEAFPHQSASGLVYDGGSHHEALQHVLRLAGYPALRDAQRRLRRQGRRLGIGLSCYTEYTGLGSTTFARRGMTDIPGHEAAAVRVDPSGTVRVALSFPSQGQGHETTMAQLVADTLGAPIERVRVDRVDTAAGPHGSGTFASRASVAGAGAVLAAAREVLEQARRAAATLLEAAPLDIESTAGRFRVRGTDRSVTFEEVAHAASHVPLGKAGALSPGLEAVQYFDPPPATFSNAAHLAVVEVDGETGTISLRRYFVAEDCGRLLNPAIVDGQIHGAVVQGLGAALLEEAAYDRDGQPLAATLLDYLLPASSDVPPVCVAHLDHPAPDRPGGCKGMGEGGAIGAPACIVNAVADAIGADVPRVPLTPERIRALLVAAPPAPARAPAHSVHSCMAPEKRTR